MMKKNVFLVPVVVFFMLLGLTGCLDSSDGENSVSYSDVYTVVGYDSKSNLPTFNFHSATVLANKQELDPQYQNKGTTLLVDFKIDYNKNINGLLFADQIHNIRVIPQHSYITDEKFSPEDINLDGLLPIDNFQHSSFSNQLGRLFIRTRLDSISKKLVNYNLIYSPSERQENDESPLSLYFYAKQEGEKIDKIQAVSSNAFNLYDLFKLGKDTIDKYDGIEYRYIKVNLKYYNDTNSSGVPQWKEVKTSEGSSDIELFMNRKDFE